MVSSTNPSNLSTLDWRKIWRKTRNEQKHMAVSWTCQISSPRCSTREHTKFDLLTKNVPQHIIRGPGAGGGTGDWTISRKMTMQKEQIRPREINKRGDRKGESKDSPEIPDRYGWGEGRERARHHPSWGHCIIIQSHQTNTQTQKWPGLA